MAGLKRCLSTLALLSLVTGPEHVAAEQPLAVVLASTAPGYAMGQVLAADRCCGPRRGQHDLSTAERAVDHHQGTL